jgi:NAD(P)-dependent dehydrogenase (short-subunit alcohol dehydrogenase family)
MDVDHDDEVEQGVNRLVAEHGRLDAVVACAGWGLAGAVEHTPIDDARAQIETNLFGAARLAKAALPFLRIDGGRIALVSSIGGVVAIPFQAYYSASKFALEGFGEALAYEVAPFGIHVTLVQPGNVRTGFTAARRTVSPPPGEDPYAGAAARAVGRMAADEAVGVDPARVATVIDRVLTERHPPRRVSVGKLGERVGIPAKRVLPQRVFERAARSGLGL